MTVKTPVGFLNTKAIGTLNYHPGVDIYVGQKDGDYDPFAMEICTVQYDEALGQLVAVVYADGNSDDPTHIIPVTLPTDTD
jgi:hypothetical protein